MNAVGAEAITGRARAVIATIVRSRGYRLPPTVRYLSRSGKAKTRRSIDGVSRPGPSVRTLRPPAIMAYGPGYPNNAGVGG
jgi:hypothetical protein